MLHLACSQRSERQINESLMTEKHPPTAYELTFTLDATRSAPLYQQLSDCLRRQVLAVNWPADSAIPSERELMRLTGVSRMTVRQAIDSLTREGLLTRVHGRGTFIVPERVEQDIRGVYSFSERIRAQGRSTATQVLEAGQLPSIREESDLLQIGDGEWIYRLLRLRCVDDEPVALNIVKIPTRFCPGLLRRDLTGSLYAILTEMYNVPPIRAVDTMEAVAAPREIAEPLGVRPGTALTLMRRIATTHDDVPIELTEEYARSDRMRYRMRLYAEPLVEDSSVEAGGERAI
jgi:GntR family transcriptional regulator